MERGTKRKFHKRDNKQGEEGSKRRKTETRKIKEMQADRQKQTKNWRRYKTGETLRAEREILKK